MTVILDRLIDLMFSTEGLAVVAGLISAWAGTQAGKKHWQFGGRRAIVLALVLGALPAYLIWPGWGAVPIAVSLTVGLVAPGAYKVAIALVRSRWPAVAEALSGDRKQ